MTRHYAYVTELPGNHVTREQIEMVSCRYAWAAGHAGGKDVLEVACGPGIGLGVLARSARRLIAGDYDPHCLRYCGPHYRGRVPILRLDAQRLPFAAGSFDLIIMFEAIYYLSEPDRFFAECHRLLRPGGTLLLALPNQDWPGFSPSPESHGYFSPPELAAEGRYAGFTVRVYGRYPQPAQTLAQRALGLIRRASARLGLVPRDPHSTEAVRRLLKRLFYGRLEPLPQEISLEAAWTCDGTELPADQPDRVHRVFYVEARAVQQSANGSTGYPTSGDRRGPLPRAP